MRQQKIKQYSVHAALLLCAVTAFSGCSSIQSASNNVKSMAVEPAPDAGFIAQPERQTKIAYLPFQKVWIDPNFNKDKYTQIIVAPVNTQYMMKMDWLHDMSSASWVGNVQNDIADLAVYFHDEVVKQFNIDPEHRFQVIDSPTGNKRGTLRLELALVEIDPSMPVLHALSWAGPPGTGTAAGVVNQRRAAFEGRLRDMKTNKIVATFADRNMQDIGPLDVTRLTWYGPAKGIMDMWAKQFVQVANRKPGEKVTDAVPFTLRPF